MKWQYHGDFCTQAVKRIGNYSQSNRVLGILSAVQRNENESVRFQFKFLEDAAFCLRFFCELFSCVKHHVSN